MKNAVKISVWILTILIGIIAPLQVLRAQHVYAMGSHHTGQLTVTSPTADLPVGADPAVNAVDDVDTIPDLSAIVPTLQDMPLGFTALSAAEMGFTTPNIGLQDMGIESYFAFQSPDEQEVMIGFTVLAPTALQQALFDTMIEYPEEVLGLYTQDLQSAGSWQAVTVLDTIGLGESASGVTATYRESLVTVQTDLIMFRRGMVGCLVMSFYDGGTEPAVSASTITQLLDQRIIALLSGEAVPAAIAQQSLTAAPAATPDDNTLWPQATVQNSALTLRSGPDVSYPILALVQPHEEVAVSGQQGDCAWLRVLTRQGKEGWVANANQAVVLDVDCTAVASEPFRPATGTMIGGAVLLTGQGQFILENQYRDDAVVVLTQTDGTPITAFYLRAQDSFTLSNISEGIYRVIYTTGKEWEQTTARFQKLDRYRRFLGEFTISTTLFSSSSYQLTIRPTSGGTERVAPDAFPSLNQ